MTDPAATHGKQIVTDTDTDKEKEKIVKQKTGAKVETKIEIKAVVL